MTKRYELHRWNSCDVRPTVLSAGTLTEMREEMAAYVKGNEISGLKPAKGFGNDQNRVTVSRPTNDDAWGIQYWIDEAEVLLYTLAFCANAAVVFPFTNLNAAQVTEVLCLVPSSELANWRVGGSDGSYILATDWKP